MPHRPHSLNSAATYVKALLPSTVIVSSELEQKAVAVLEQALSATCFVRSSEKGKSGQRIYTEQPDHAMRVVAAAKLLELRRGRPTQPLEVRGASGTRGQAITTRDLVRLVAEDPGLIKKFMDTAHTVEVEATPSADSQPNSQS